MRTFVNEYIDVSNDTLRKAILGDDGEEITTENEHLLDTSQYTTRLTPSRDLIRAGDLVVIQPTFNKLDFVYCQPGEVYSNRNGKFPHDDFIGKPFGTKLRSSNFKGYGYCYILKPTPELWTRSLTHRTQIIHELDQSQILFELDIVPNCTVIESGTGSAALSHSFARTLAPAGHLHTYEFNPQRHAAAQTECERHGLSHLVTVYHRDVCTQGFDRPPNSVDAALLDVPEPWEAVPHAAYVLRTGGGKLASYSPCVEQTQRTVAALEACNFHSIRTMEYRLKEYYVDALEMKPPPTARRESRVAKPRPKEETDGSGAGDSNKVDDTKESKKRSVSGKPKDDEQEQGVPKKKLLAARPFSSMRGHTAFLTFATAGLIPQPDPLAKTTT